MNRIVFFHVPKCAGTTIYEHLETQIVRTPLDRLLGRNRTKLVHFRVHAESLNKKTKRAANAKLVYGHFGWDTYLRMKPKDGDFKFTFLRDPIERLQSSYNFFCSSQGWKWLNLGGNPSDYSFEDYLAAHARVDLWSIDNVAVRMFSGCMERKPLNDQDWQELVLKAQDRVSKLNYIGFQDDLETDFQIICRLIGVSSDNVERKRTSQTSRSRQDSPSSSVALTEFSKWDRQLYDFAKSHAANLRYSENI